MARSSWREVAAVMALGMLILTACGDDGPSGSDDTVRPGPIRDLSASTSGVTTVALAWTSVGDDSLTGTASAYDVRFTTSSTPRWDLMTSATGEPSPKEAGAPESFTVTGLAANTNYRFIVKTFDDKMLTSAESNVAVATTLATEADLGWWPGFAPHPEGQGTNGAVYALAPFRDELVAGGIITRVGPAAVFNVAAWDGDSWRSLGTGVNGAVVAMTPYGDRLAVGGAFTAAGGHHAMYLAFWDGTGWAPASADLDGPVSAMTVYDGDLIVGGGFVRAGADTVRHIARYDGERFRPLGEGMDDWIVALAVYDGKLIAGGYFTHAGGDSAVYVASWDGEAWRSMGDGAAEPAPSSAAVQSLAEYNGSLMAGGTFQALGGVPAAYLARWDGGAWSSMDEVRGGAFTDPGVFAMEVRGNDLYLAGRFQSIGATDCNHVAAWDGATFRPLGVGIVGQGWRVGVALAAYQNSLYLGGTFNAVGNRPAAGIARWDGP
jgi:hypothetical protein